MLSLDRTCPLRDAYEEWAWEKRGAQELVHGHSRKGSTRNSNVLEDYRFRAGGFSAMNVIGTRLRDPVNSGLTLSMMV